MTPDCRADRKRLAVFAALLAFGVLLRIEYLREFSTSPLFGFALGADVSEYYERAQAILNGVFSSASPDIHAPLYSWFLALELFLTGGSAAAVRSLQLALNLLAWCGFYFLLRRKSTGRTPELVFGMAMLYLPLVFFQAEFVSEFLLIPLLIGSVSCTMAADDRTDRRGDGLAAAGGVLAGLACITHPTTLLYLVLQTGLFAWSKKWRRVAVYAVCALVCILPVSVARSLEAGRPVLVQSNSAFNFWLGNSGNADGTCWLRPGARWKKFHGAAAAEAARTGTTKDAVFLRRTLEFYAARPLSAAKLFVRKALLVFAPGELPAGADAAPVFGWTPLMRYGAPFCTVLVLATGLAGLPILLRDEEKRKRYAPLLLLTGAFGLAQILFVTSGRYRLPMLPGLFVAAAIFWQWKPRPAWRKLVPAGAACLIVAASVWQTPRRDHTAECRTLFAEAMHRLKRPDAVAALLRGHAATSNDPARDLCLLALAERALGRPDEAERLLQEAAKIAPAEAEALMDLGILRSESGRLAEAEAFFREAEKREPDHAGTLYNHALVLEKMRRYPEAEKRLQLLVRLDPAHQQGWNTLGRVFFMQKRLAEAEDAFAHAVRLAPDNAGFRRNLDLARRARREAGK